MAALPEAGTAPRRARWDGRRVLFEVRHEGAEVPCAISPDALRDLTAERCSRPADLLRCFAAERARVEAAILGKLRARRFPVSGLPTIWPDDIEEFEAPRPAPGGGERA